jgi:hypothetical protein
MVNVMARPVKTAKIIKIVKNILNISLKCTYLPSELSSSDDSLLLLLVLTLVE